MIMIGIIDVATMLIIVMQVIDAMHPQQMAAATQPTMKNGIAKNKRRNGAITMVEIRKTKLAMIRKFSRGERAGFGMCFDGVVEKTAALYE